MYYPFPHITNISQVLPAIKDRSEFIVANKPGGYTVVNYLVNFVDTFPRVSYTRDGSYSTEEDEHYAIRRECRGIKFDTATGNIISRPYHKFFNVNERDETQVSNIDMHINHEIFAKLDGSMITPLIVDGVVRYGTKMGVTEVSKPVEEFVSQHPFYNDWCRQIISQNITPIFEWLSRKQRIVIDYPEDKLVLTAMRDNHTGEYLDMDGFTASLGTEIPVVDSASAIKSLDDFINTMRTASGVEGWVLRFYDGHCVKIKTDEYVKIHKAKDGLRFEKDVLDLVLNEKLDDVKPYLSGAELDNVNRYESAVWQGVSNTVASLVETFNLAKEKYAEDRKSFALEFANKQSHLLKPIYFQMYTGKDPRGVVVDTLKRSTSSQTTVDDVRSLFNVKWIE